MKILIIEDDQAVAESVKGRLEEGVDGAKVETELSFAGALGKIQEFQPDLLVLDVLEGEDQPPVESGYQVRSNLTCFVPIVFYSAADGARPQTGPFEAFVSKTDEDAIVKLVTVVNQFSPHIDALREIEVDVHAMAMEVLEASAGPIWELENHSERRTELLKRSVRRRIAASMDMTTLEGGNALSPWELYIYPALGTDCLAGDILRQRDGSPGDPKSYRLVLTPSCDLVIRNDKAKVPSLLVAKCEPISRFLQVCGISAARLGEEDARKQLARALRQPQSSGFVALPGYSTVLPHMAVCLRGLELLPLAGRTIKGEGDVTYERIVSIDSPFREAISWAYLQIAGRPGLPERDMSAWTSEIQSNQTS